MTRRAPLPKITECVEKEEAMNRISRAHLLRGAYPFVVVCALCLAHVHLQFSRIDMLVQESQLQGQQRVLLRELAVLERQVETIDNENLKARARRDFNMEELVNPTKDLLAVIPQSLQEKYSQPLDTEMGDVVVAELRSSREQRGGLRDAILSLFEGGRAMASVATDRRH